jgi:hypothetical protein
MKKEKTIKITEFGMKPELVGAIIKYIAMITAPIPKPNPKPDGIPKPKKITLAEVAITLAGVVKTLAGVTKTLNNFILETRANFKQVNERIANLVKKNNLKE